MPFLCSNSVALSQLCRVSPVNGETEDARYEIAPQTRSDPRNPWIAIAYLYRLGRSNAEPFCSLFNPDRINFDACALPGNRVREQNGTVFASRWGDDLRKPRFHVIDQAPFMQPTILTNIKHDNPAFRTEFFGPVALFFRVKNEDDAVALANDSNFGLG
jgi:hypothetical protein